MSYEIPAEWLPSAREVLALIGGWGAGIVTTYFTERSRQAAIKAGFADIIAQEAQKAHAQEKGKRLATAEDVSALAREIAQARQIESVKASTAYQRWLQECIRNERRADYVAVTKSLKELIQALQVVNRDEEEALQ
ncbi:MAG: hypothetical protein JNK87_07505, partial [Bryobacterales bacterium]|nr:hypothetical protein [Bryobacterales bacterium]